MEKIRFNERKYYFPNDLNEMLEIGKINKETKVLVNKVIKLLEEAEDEEKDRWFYIELTSNNEYSCSVIEFNEGDWYTKDQEDEIFSFRLNQNYELADRKLVFTDGKFIPLKELEDI